MAAPADPVRQAALDRVMERRVRGRARSRFVRALAAAAGALLGAASLPLIVLLPEVGIPALLVALRLLAVEFDWAASAYAWIAWRWAQARAWYHGRSRTGRWLIVLALVGVAAALVWLLVHELG